MNPYRVLEKHTWSHRDIFEFFQDFENPTVNVTVPLDASRLYQCAKDTGRSFFQLSLYAILRAANEVPQVRQRILTDGTVVEFERIAAMTPIMTPEENFCQVWGEYTPSYALFAEAMAPHIAAGKKGISNLPEGFGMDYICASCNPWFHFTAFSQANKRIFESVPILAWGKMVKGLVPIGCKFHHGLMDGLHMGRFFSSIERSFAAPEELDQEMRFS